MAKYAFLFVLLLCSCRSAELISDELELSLEIAGDRRKEFEFVLEHFKQDRKKYEAACFLIENMQYHQSKENLLVPDSIPCFFHTVDSLYVILFEGLNAGDLDEFNPKLYDSLRLEIADRYRDLPSPEIGKNTYKDLDEVKASFLIDHIEAAFFDWKNNPFSKKLTFDEFKEFLLPYRTTNEPLLAARHQLRELYQKVIVHDSCEEITDAIENFIFYVERCRWINYHISQPVHSGWYDLFLPKFGMDCHNMTNWSIQLVRAQGIPAVYEYTPQWIDRDRRHFWTVSPDANGIYQPYTLPDNNLREDYDNYIKYAGKVYRRGFAANKRTPYFLANEYEFIPEEFRSPVLNDQTFRYHQTITLRMATDKTVENNLVYLCMFNQGKLQPVGWGTVDHQKSEVVLEQVPLNVVFQAAYYEEDYLIPLNDPFIVASTERIDYIPLPLTVNNQTRPVDLTWNGKTFHFTDRKTKSARGLEYREIKPDDQVIPSMLLTLKYPEKRTLKTLYKDQVGGVLLARSSKKEPYDTLLVIKSPPLPHLQQFALDAPGAYAEYRFSCSGRPVNVAHIEFLGPYSEEHLCVEPTSLPVFNPDQNIISADSLYCFKGEIVNTSKTAHSAFDNNFDTYVASSSVAMTFEPPAFITHIRFAPRNANNMIVPGDRYRLQYYDEGWKTHETVTAQDHFLLFGNVPAGTLYLLKNLDNGKEELPFFYIGGKQYFIHIDNPPFDQS